jgi:uncharacterized protein YjbI with pentapeptide repeats
MANQEQLVILRQGVEAWNSWRRENPDTELDLRRVDLSKANLKGAVLGEGNLRGVLLRKASLQGAKLWGTDLREADLTGAELILANLTVANLSKADLTGAELGDANLSGAYLWQANLTGAHLTGANLTGADLGQTNFTEAIFGHTILGENDLSSTGGLDTALHVSPSFISTRTIQLSKGKIPSVFLRGCGLSDWEIEAAKLYNAELSNQEITDILYKVHDLRAQHPIQISPLFISYSHLDSEFVDKLEDQLNQKGIRFWRDIHDTKAGRLEKQIEMAIRTYQTVLLVLSANSVRGDWVQHEVRMARELEKETGRDVLCPVALDESWKTCSWPKRIMEQVTEYKILDFSKWEDDIAFGEMFARLIDGLELFYKLE